MCDKSYIKDEYEPLRKNIERLYYSQEDIRESLIKTKEFYEIIKTNNASDYNFHFTHMMFSKIYNKDKQKEKAIKHVITSKKYLEKYNNILTLVAENIQQLGMCYKDLDNDKALSILNICYEYCRDNKLFQHMAGVLDEIAMMTNDLGAIKFAIEVYANLEISDLQYKQNSLDAMYEHCFDICMYHGLLTEAQESIHNIKNQCKAKILKLKMIKLA